MKRKLHFFILLMSVAYMGFAQLPPYYNVNGTGGANTFPFSNSATSRKVTWFIPANDLQSPTPLLAGNAITHVWFKFSNTTTRTFPNFNIKLKNGTGTGLVNGAGGPCETGLTVVYQATNFVMNTTAGSWYSFQLITPWPYNPSLPLIVEVEHDATTGTGGYVYQTNNIPGPGNGRQWSNYQAVTITGAGTNRVDFGVTVVPTTPCSGTPGANSVVTPTAGICPNSVANISLANSYTVGGITYAWQSSTVSAVGPWSAVPNATLPSINTPSLTVPTYYQAIITCTNGNGSVTATAGTVNVQSVTTNTAPYFEGFEGIGQNDKLPNCSWASSHPGSTCLTYTSVQNQNRIPRTGTSFASFYYSPANNNSFWTNGIWLEAGLTYSASMWYQTEYYTYPTWQLNILLNTSQTAAGSTTIATSGGSGSAASPSYKSLSNTFSVPTSGYYHVGINAISNGGCCGYYLSWDDLEISVPCQLNPVPLVVNANSSTICAGQPVNLTATGADTYLWNTGATSGPITLNPQVSTTYTVVGTNAISGCTAMATQYIEVNPSPIVSAIANDASICAGKTTNVNAFGANTYLWSNNASGSSVSVTPVSTTNYTVIGTNNFGCSGSAVVTVSVNPLPVVTINSSAQGNLVCAEDETELTGTGAITYQWSSPTSLTYGNPALVSPNTSATYTLVGTDANGCQGTSTYQLNVTECVGLKDVSTTASGIKLYPNPSKGEFIIEIQDKMVHAIEVSDLSGRRLYSTSSNQDKISVDLSSFANGVYYVKVSSDKQQEVIKIVKQ